MQKKKSTNWPSNVGILPLRISTSVGSLVGSDANAIWQLYVHPNFSLLSSAYICGIKFMIKSYYSIRTYRMLLRRSLTTGV